MFKKLKDALSFRRIITAKKKQLSEIGELIGLKRKIFEPDFFYRQRLIEYVYDRELLGKGKKI